MQIEIKIDASLQEPKIIIATNQMTDEINALVKKLSEDTLQMLAGFQDGCVEILEQTDILRIYATSGKVIAETMRGAYTLRARLYELEQRLDRHSFVRISNSEVVNLKMVKRFDLSVSGTICVTLSNGIVTYVSRRYVAKIKQILGI